MDHLLSYVTNEQGSTVAIHADLKGIDLLISELEGLRNQLLENDCPHTHLRSTSAAGNELSTTKLAKQPNEVNIVHHVKIYGWNDEWAVKHRLR